MSFFKFHPYSSLLPSPITQRLHVLASNRTQHLLNLHVNPWRIRVTSIPPVFYQYSMTQKRNYPYDVKLSSLISLSSNGDPVITVCRLFAQNAVMLFTLTLMHASNLYVKGTRCKKIGWTHQTPLNIFHSADQITKHHNQKATQMAQSQLIFLIWCGLPLLKLLVLLTWVIIIDIEETCLWY